MAKQKTATRGKASVAIDETVIPSDKVLKAIAQLVTKQLALQDALQKKEEEYNVIVKALRTVQEDLLPSLMDEAGLKTITLSDGHSVKVSPDLSVSIPKDNKESCYAWLKDHGAEGIIKSDVSLTFDRGELKEAEVCIKALKKLGYDASVREVVHASTLKATLKEFMAKAVDVPLQLFGAQAYSKAIIK